MSTSKAFPTLKAASAACGVILQDGLTYADMSEVAEHALGYPVWTHELGDEKTMQRVCDAIHAQFPQLPTREEAQTDWQGAADRATRAYGETIELEKGNQVRGEDPLQTLQRMTGGAA